MKEGLAGGQKREGEKADWRGASRLKEPRDESTGFSFYLPCTSRLGTGEACNSEPPAGMDNAHQESLHSGQVGSPQRPRRQRDPTRPSPHPQSLDAASSTGALHLPAGSHEVVKQHQMFQEALPPTDGTS